jgi:hypothetical protein
MSRRRQQLKEFFYFPMFWDRVPQFGVPKMHIRLSWLVCLLPGLFFVPVAVSQIILPTKVPDTTLITNISPENVQAYYEQERSAVRENAPRIVFLPGILGSRIDECFADNSRCTTLWGTAAALVDSKDLDLTMKEGKIYRTDVIDRVLFKEFYGPILDYTQSKADNLKIDTLNDHVLTVFHYDWRISNGVNAKLLADRICAVRTAAPHSRIYILAHSMGGLIAKFWAA